MEISSSNSHSANAMCIASIARLLALPPHTCLQAEALALIRKKASTTHTYMKICYI